MKKKVDEKRTLKYDVAFYFNKSRDKAARKGGQCKVVYNYLN